MRWALIAVSSLVILRVAAACGGSDSGASAGVLADGSAPDSPGAGGDANAPSAADPRILPLVVGHKWTFSSQLVDGGGRQAFCQGEQTTEVLGPGGTYDAGPSLRYKAFCLPPGRPVVDIVGTGDDLTAYILTDAGTSGSAVHYLATPVEDGHEWDYSTPGGLRFAWHSAGTVTVKAGTFNDCWRRQATDPARDPGYVIYCRGVGQVRESSPDYEAELTAKNF